MLHIFTLENTTESEVNSNLGQNMNQSQKFFVTCCWGSQHVFLLLLLLLLLSIETQSFLCCWFLGRRRCRRHWWRHWRRCRTVSSTSSSSGWSCSSWTRQSWVGVKQSSESRTSKRPALCLFESEEKKIRKLSLWFQISLRSGANPIRQLSLKIKMN